MGQQSLKLGWAIRDTFRSGYNLKNFGSDLKAGFTVGIVAIPLGMALGIASGVAPQNGLYTVIIGGFIAALLGGSRFQVTGPTAAFVVLLLPVVNQFGVSGLLVAGFFAGLILLIMGYMRVAQMIQFIPHPVTTGFTAGIATVIAVIQLKDLFGLKFIQAPNHFHERIFSLVQAFPEMQWRELVIGCATLALIIISHKKIKLLPAPVVALTGVTIMTYLWQHFVPELSIATIGTEFSYLNPAGEVMQGIPRGLPQFQWPWEYSVLNQLNYTLDFNHVIQIMPYALSIALLGAIESLLSATVADGATKKQHNPNAELIGQGISNLICPFFGGIPATGAIARTMTNIRFGGFSPISAIVHSGVVLFSLLVLAPVINHIPMAALAGVLLFVAYNMAERKHVMNILRAAPRDDKLVLFACFFFTVVTDMTVGVGVGMVLATLLFMRRISSLTGVDILNPDKIEESEHMPVPDGVFLYRIKGSLFFGAAQRALRALSQISDQKINMVIVDLSSVQLIDATGWVALESALENLSRSIKKIVILKPSDEFMSMFNRADSLKQLKDKISFAQNLKDALDSSVNE